MRKSSVILLFFGIWIPIAYSINIEDDKARSEVTFRHKFDMSNFTEPVYSPVFYARNMPWKLNIKSSTDKKHLGVFLFCDEVLEPSPRSCYANVELRLISHQPDKPSVIWHYKHMFQGDEYNWGFSEFKVLTDVMDPKQGFIQDHIITMEVLLITKAPLSASDSKIRTGKRYFDELQFRSDYPYSPQAGGWMKFHRVPATFQQAFLRCNFEGALLASPLNADIRQALVSELEAHKDSTVIFTGINAIFSKGDFASVEGVPLEKMPVLWTSDAPDDGVEDCTVLQQDGKIKDVKCNETFPYICYKKRTGKLNISACGTVDKEYTYVPQIGSCYKFHTVGRNWRGAYMICKAEGGHLAIINSYAEAQVIQEIYGNYSSSTIMSQHKEQAAIGIFTSAEHGEWFTIHGETLANAGYAWFSEGHPEINTLFDGGSNCGAVRRDGLLTDIWCDSVTFPFICEKNPTSLAVDDEEL